MRQEMRLLRPTPPVVSDTANFPPLFNSDIHHSSLNPEDNSTNRIRPSSSKHNNSFNDLNRFKKAYANPNSNNYANAARNNLKSIVSIDSVNDGSSSQAPVSEADFKNLISFITSEFKKINQKLDNHIQNQLYVFHNVQDSPMEFSEYSAQETGAGNSCDEL